MVPANDLKSQYLIYSMSNSELSRLFQFQLNPNYNLSSLRLRINQSELIAFYFAVLITFSRVGDGRGQKKNADLFFQNL